MPKKQKSKSSTRDKNAAVSFSTKLLPSDDPVCACIELNLKPSPRRQSSRNDIVNTDIYNRYAIVHWSDAYKLDLHDGEPALVVHIATASHELKSGNRDSVLAAVCKVRISPAMPSLNSNISTTKSRAPLSSTPPPIYEASSRGVILLSTNSLYEFFSPVAAAGTEAAGVEGTTSTSSATANALNASPSKSRTPCSENGGAVSPISPSSYLTSPSGSKFSFSKGGGGDFLLSPVQNKPLAPSAQSTKNSPKKALLIPLINFPPQQLRELCPDAQKLLICPLNNTSKTPINAHLSYSTNIIQTLIISKYQGTYMQPQTTVQSELGHTITNNISNSSLGTISIAFRGQVEKFHIVDMLSLPNQGGQTIQRDIEEKLSLMFNQLYLSSRATPDHPNSAETNKEWQLLNILKLHTCKQQRKDRRWLSFSRIAYRVTTQTKIDFISSLNEVPSVPPQIITNSPHVNETQQLPCAGIESTLFQIKDTLLPLILHPNLFPDDGPLRLPKGALLFGPSGVGKSLLASQIANYPSFAPLHIRLIQCANILSSTATVGQAEKMLTDIFEEAEQMAMDSSSSLVILDDIHLICPRRGTVGGGRPGVDQLAGTLLALLDGIGSIQKNVEHKKYCRGPFVLAITTDPLLLDPALRRPGRLDVEVELPVPDDHARADILGFHLSRLTTAQQIDVRSVKVLAHLAKGFTGADCKLAVKEAARIAISRTLMLDSGGQARGFAGRNVLSVAIDYADLEHSIRMTKPSAIKSVSVEVPKVPWSAIGGMDDVKALLKESIELPLTHPHLFEMMQIPSPKGILLYGPPGCSKTLMARAIATEGSMNFLAVKGPELLSKWLGESERALASLFRRARLAAPAVIFFDEIDAIASKRGEGGKGGGDRLLSQLLTELDGITTGGRVTVKGKSGKVVVLGATNRPDILDAALTRPGRMDRMIYVGLPDEHGRKDIFEIGLSCKDCHKDVDISFLASDEISKGYSGAEIIALCRDAALHVIGEMDDGNVDRPQVHMRHLLQSINNLRPRTTEGMLQFYESFHR